MPSYLLPYAFQACPYLVQIARSGNAWEVSLWHRATSELLSVESAPLVSLAYARAARRVIPLRVTTGGK